jgi:hypothetical protein
MAPKASSGPGRAQRRDRSEGRSARTKTGPSSGGVGRYTPPEQSGRYTRPIPKKVRRSAPWYGPTIVALFVLGLLMILLNYMSVLPGATSTWYLVGGLVFIVAAFGMATRYR